MFPSVMFARSLVMRLLSFPTKTSLFGCAGASAAAAPLVVPSLSGDVSDFMRMRSACWNKSSVTIASVRILNRF